MKMIATYNHPDFKNNKGLWVRTKKIIRSDNIAEVQHSRSSEIWSSIVRRTNKEGSYQKQNPTYTCSENNFQSYQDFASWCQTKEDYWKIDDNGRWWQLDKDLLIRGNKIYSPSTCIFVPQAVNTCYSNVEPDEGGLQGVRLDIKTQKYVARCCVEGSTSRHIAYYITAQDAHRAWQEAKIKQTEILIDKSYSKEVNSLLKAVKERLCNDVNRGEVTLYV